MSESDFFFVLESVIHTLGFRNPYPGILEYENPNTKYSLAVTECGIQGLESGIQAVGVGIQIPHGLRNPTRGDLPLLHDMWPVM